MRHMLALALLTALTGMLALGASYLPDTLKYEIPHLSTVPIPGAKPPTPAQIAAVKQEMALAEARERIRQLEAFKAAQHKRRGADMCVRWGMVPQRHPGNPFLTTVVPKPRGVVPCHAIGHDELTWIMNGKDI